MPRQGLLAICLILGGCLTQSACAAEPREFVTELPAPPSVDLPVSIDLPAEFRGSTPLGLERTADRHSVPIQRVGESQAILILPATNPPVATQTFTLRLEKSSPEWPQSLHFQEENGQIRLLFGNHPLFHYHVAALQPPTGLSPLYERSGFLHPVFTPAGHIVTEAFPADHRHQHAIFDAWVNVEFQGHHVDFWNQHLGLGTVEHRQLLRQQAGPALAQLQVQLASVDLSQSPRRTDALTETWTLSAYACRQGTLFDLELQQHCAGPNPVILKKYHYGGMAARGAAGWTPAAGFRFLTADGRNQTNGNHTRPAWVNLSGPVAGQPVNLTMFTHPDNPRSPQPVRIPPEFPYAAYAPIVDGDLTIRPDQPYQAKYRFFVQDGPAVPDRLNQVGQNFTTPVKIRWK